MWLEGFVVLYWLYGCFGYIEDCYFWCVDDWCEVGVVDVVEIGDGEVGVLYGIG